MNKQIKLLVEGLFDDDIFNDNNSSQVENIEALLTLYLVNLQNILTLILGTDKPRGWKVGKDKDQKEIIYREEHSKYSFTEPSKLITNVSNELISSGWTKYECSEYPYCFCNNINDMIPYVNAAYSDYFINYLERRKNSLVKYRKWVTEIYPSMPAIIQKYFRDALIKMVVASPHNDMVMVLRSDDIDTRDQLVHNRDGAVHYAYIKILDESNLYEINNKDKKRIIEDKKQNDSKIAFLKLRLRKYCNSVDIKEFILKNNEPIGVTCFNWEENVNEGHVSKAVAAYHLPYLVRFLLKLKIYMLNELEKDDDKAIYEFTKGSLIFKFYKNIDCSNFKNKLNTIGSLNNADSCMTCELTDYALEQYHDIFDKK